MARGSINVISVVLKALLLVVHVVAKKKNT